MSAERDDDWLPDLDGSTGPSESFKWGWNAETGEVSVWRVSGGVDGYPTHELRLTEEWGRGPSISRGDLLGYAVDSERLSPEVRAELPRLSITTYYKNSAPEAVSAWFRSEFPTHHVEELDS